MFNETSITKILPSDWRKGLFLGRIQTADGPSPILVQDGMAYDLSKTAPTTSELANLIPINAKANTLLGPLEALEFPLLSPVDLQCIKACGVTFASSALERVIEEASRGNSGNALKVRERIEAQISSSLRKVVPGSTEAQALKEILIENHLWSQYLEVAIGPYAEVFTKAPVLSTVGPHAEVGIRSDSKWNNPEPEIVLVINARGEAIGATLGNDVNLRDLEGRSALLLGKAKDNNASCAIGPLIRLFDDDFTLSHIRESEVDLLIEGKDGFRLEGKSNMSDISREPLDLVSQTLSEHQYPDGFALFLGTMFTPVKDRDVKGEGFTHKVGDVVKISNSYLGVLSNTVTTSANAKPWTIGIAEFYKNLSLRGLI
jgi:fumarylacetoacetate (FAA) hydrolase family protein